MTGPVPLQLVKVTHESGGASTWIVPVPGRVADVEEPDVEDLAARAAGHPGQVEIVVALGRFA